MTIRLMWTSLFSGEKKTHAIPATHSASMSMWRVLRQTTPTLSDAAAAVAMQEKKRLP